MKCFGCTQIARRAGFWLFAALLAFAALGWRLWQIQIEDHARYLAQAKQRQDRCWPIEAPRGNIYDRNGNPLALNLKLFSVAADPELVGDRRQVAARLSPLLKDPVSALREKLNAPDGVRFVRLQDAVDPPTADAVREIECDGLIVETQWRRAYPHQNTAASMLGFVGRDGHGLAGIERSLNDRLAGTDGEMLVVLDGRMPDSRAQIPGRTVVTKPMTPGRSVLLTLDLDIQIIAEEALAAAVNEADAAGGAAIVMDPHTGDVLALAEEPGFNPNQFWRFPADTWVPDTVACPYEPGSTFKVITACAALEEGIMSAGETYPCTGTRPVGGGEVNCAPHGGTRAHGELDLDGIVIRSCNCGIATVALKLGARRLHYWARRLGFGERTGIELQGESPGILPSPDRWSQMRVANVGFGQGISVTPLQLLSAYCAIANGGWLVRPRLVKAVTAPTGEMQETDRAEPARVLSPFTAARVRDMLVRVIEEGTGNPAAVPGRRVAGKTGTAQKPTRAAKYRSGAYVASFAGFAPAESPRLAVLVVIDEPRNGHYGGTVAGPAFREICERALTHFRVPPGGPPPRVDLAQASGRG